MRFVIDSDCAMELSRLSFAQAFTRNRLVGDLHWTRSCEFVNGSTVSGEPNR